MTIIETKMNRKINSEKDVISSDDMEILPAKLCKASSDGDDKQN